MNSKNKKKMMAIFASLALSSAMALGVTFVAACNNQVGGGGESRDSYYEPCDAIGMQSAPGVTYYVAPSASGTGASEDDPASITSMFNSNRLKAGDTVLVAPGDYNISTKLLITTSGAYNNYITIKNASSTEQATIKFYEQGLISTARGVELYGSYINWIDIDIAGAGDNGMYVGGSYNYVVDCEFYDNRDTGLQIGRQESSHTSISQWPSYNVIRNCTSHNNYDNESSYGENADGFAAKLTIGYGNVFDGCIAYRNCDDGWDLFAKDESGNIGCVYLYNCISFENGFLEYTQNECNARFPYMSKDYPDGGNTYTTSKGDGNGFKLGGSTMPGDVVMENCLSFNNRMHGVTDNSNPGMLMVRGVTSYDNGLAIDNDPTSPSFGHVINRKSDEEGHGNINMSRQTYSYNGLDRVLSVRGEYGVGVGEDEFRGSVGNSVLLGSGNKSYNIKGFKDLDTKNGVNGEEVASTSAKDIFKQLPVEVNSGTPTYNVNVLSGASNIHKSWRNADGSINIHDLFAIKDSYSLGGTKIGAYLNKSKMEDYDHISMTDMLFAADKDASVILRTADYVDVPVDVSACYQNFKVNSKMLDCTIAWTSSDETILRPVGNYTTSISNTEYIDIDVTRPEADTEVTLTADITYKSITISKAFKITVKADVPTVGEITVMAEDGEIVADGGRYILDGYAKVSEPKVRVANGSKYDGTLLDESKYDVTTKYEWAASADGNFITVLNFTPNHEGMYRITKTVNLKGQTETKSMTYNLYVASKTADVQFIGDPAINVNLNGYTISGNLAAYTGKLYAVSLAEKISGDLQEYDITQAQNVREVEFRDDKLSEQFASVNDNTASYYIYYALYNLAGQKTAIKEVEIKSIDVGTKDDLVKVMGGTALQGEKQSETIYKLTADIDLGGAYTTPSGKFSGLLNGAKAEGGMWTISNATVTGIDGGAGLMYVNGGTITNVKFSGISITATKDRAGIVYRNDGGYFNNIWIDGCTVSGTSRNGLLIGHNYEGDTYVNRVKVTNSTVTSSSNRAAAIIGFVQANNPATRACNIELSNCYVASDVKIEAAEGVGGMIGAFDANAANYPFTLKMSHCVNVGEVYSTDPDARCGGMVGFQSNGKSDTVIDIEGCVNVGKLYYKPQTGKTEILADGLKNGSGIVGGFSTGIYTVKNCYSTMTEYNTEFSVYVFTDYNSVEIKEKLEALGFDAEIWEYVFKAESETELEAPYLRLK